jgi:hypothetical protein
MKTPVFLILAAVAVGVAVADSKTDIVQPPSQNNYGGGYPTYYRSSTAAEGSMRGMADVVRSQGQANLSNSAAAINYSQARSNEIDNRRQATETYFDMRRMNKAYRDSERKPKPSMEDLVRYAQAGKPKRLSPSELNPVTGTIRWPILLRSDEFTDNRAKLEKAFAERASHGVVGTDDYMKIKKTTAAMQADLKKQIRKAVPDQYMVAKRFLESLAFEAGLPAS